MNQAPKLHVHYKNMSIAISILKRSRHKYPNNPAWDVAGTKDIRTPARLSAGSPSHSPVQQRGLARSHFSPFQLTTRGLWIWQDLFTAPRKFALTGLCPERTPRSPRSHLRPTRHAGNECCARWVHKRSQPPEARCVVRRADRGREVCHNEQNVPVWWDWLATPDFFRNSAPVTFWFGWRWLLWLNGDAPPPCRLVRIPPSEFWGRFHIICLFERKGFLGRQRGI
jgi:hypothetical protein